MSNVPPQADHESRLTRLEAQVAGLKARVDEQRAATGEVIRALLSRLDLIDRRHELADMNHLPGLDDLLRRHFPGGG